MSLLHMKRKQWVKKPFFFLAALKIYQARSLNSIGGTSTLLVCSVYIMQLSANQFRLWGAGTGTSFVTIQYHYNYPFSSEVTIDDLFGLKKIHRKRSEIIFHSSL